MDSSAFLYDVSPVTVKEFCRIMDSGDGRFGWRELAIRIAPSMLDVRMLDRVEMSGRSPTGELWWSWAQQNSQVQDLCKVLQDMGHQRALQLFQGLDPAAPGDQSAESTGRRSLNQVKEPSKTKSSSSSPAFFPWNSADQNVPKLTITFEDVIEGTRNFHPELRIHEGHFSDVYVARIGSQKLAVKLFKQINRSSWKQQWDIFRKEMEIHNLYHHPNILDLLGCFSDEERYCLVFPYLHNGSLFHRLHQQHDAAPLSWSERLVIIKGIAKALHHMHSTQPCSVICGNMSSSNVLLDDTLQPKLCDFGVARLRPTTANQNLTITMTRSSHSNLGYLPEEYLRDGKLSSGLDVYSFGMIVMETVTGRKVIEDGPKQTQLRDLLLTEVECSGGRDSCLRFLDSTAGQWPAAVALCLLGLALDCTASRHRSRPTMEQVLVELSKLLPPPSCPTPDQPRSLDDGALLEAPKSLSSSPPLEQNKQPVHPSSPSERAGPCECSQSEVTYLSDASGGAADLYNSWPTQCSCPAEAGAEVCEDCRANGFTPEPAENFRSEFCVVENAAKTRLRDKLNLYNAGVIATEELFSETGPQDINADKLPKKQSISAGEAR